MSVPAKKWAEMSAEERAADQAARAAGAMSRIQKGEFPTGIPGEVIGKILARAGQKGVLRPTGETGTGGVSYAIPAGTEVTVGSETFRFNRLSVSMIGKGKAASKSLVLPDGVQENLLKL